MIPYFQTTPFTTAASSLLTVLHHLNPETKQNQQTEFHIWRKTVTLPTRGSSIFALAKYAKQFNPKLIIENKEYKFPDYRFYRYTKQDIDHAEISSNFHFKDAEKHVNIEERKIEFTEIKQQLKNNIIILRVNAKPIRNNKRNTSNYIVVNHYENGYSSIIDPAFAALSVPEETLKEAFTSLETKKYRDHRMLLFPK